MPTFSRLRRWMEARIFSPRNHAAPYETGENAMSANVSNVLFVSTSLMAEASNSRQVAAELIASWQAASPETRVVERHLTPASIPHLSIETLGAGAVPAEQRSAEQKLAAALADTLIAEVEAADTIVLATPMYNFSVSTLAKAWLDH